MHILNKINYIISIFFIFFIKIYQYFISPLLGNNCRFHPTCSNYAVQALLSYNIFVALYLICYRIIRCQPFCIGGYDPVLGQEKSSKNPYLN